MKDKMKCLMCLNLPCLASSPFWGGGVVLSAAAALLCCAFVSNISFLGLGFYGGGGLKFYVVW